MLEALEYYPVVQGYNISYREKDFEKESKSVFGLSQHEANAVALFTCTPCTSVVLHDCMIPFSSTSLYMAFIVVCVCLGLTIYYLYGRYTAAVWVSLGNDKKPGCPWYS